MTKLASLAISILLVGSFVGIEPAGASGPISHEDALCRSYLYAGSSKLARGVITRLTKCHGQRLRGNLPPATDCNDPANAVGTLHLARYDDAIRARAASRCQGVASPPASLGYTSCPAPCDGIIVNSYANFAECLICFTRASMSSLSEGVLGTPTAPAASDLRRCQERIGRATSTYMAKRLTVQRRCQLDQDNGDISPMIDCETADPDGRMAAALANLQVAVARCDASALASLDSCGATVAAEQACVAPASDSATADLFDLVYYPQQILFTPTPTVSPTITNTPTITSTPTVTPTFDPNNIEMVFAPAGGTTTSCRGTCSGGMNNGLSCASNAACPGGMCAARVCVGGPLDGTACTGSSSCNGCAENPQVGSCLTLQNPIFAVRVALNGVCAPRTPPDVPCTTDVECGMGQTCEYGRLSYTIVDPDMDGIALFVAQQALVQFPPSVVSGIGTVCITAAEDGQGAADCDGGASGIDSLTSQDHNTTPGDPNNSGSGNGLPDDPTCTNTFLLPNGQLSYACEEGTEQCFGGINAGSVCTMDSECPGSTCEPCNGFSSHTGVCNSPIHVVESGTFGSGDLAFNLPINLHILEAGDRGPDDLACTADDTLADPPTRLMMRITTGTASGEIFDAANANGERVGAGEMCGSSPCIAEIDGAAVTCTDLQNHDLDGLVLGGAATLLDTAAGDIVTTLRLEALP